MGLSIIRRGSKYIAAISGRITLYRFRSFRVEFEVSNFHTNY